MERSLSFDQVAVLLPEASFLGGVRPAAITGICLDSRKAKPGDLFVAVKGGKRDGREFARDALSRGAAAVLAEGDVACGAPQVLVRDAGRSLRILSAAFYGNPERRLRFIGVTGTNGKTTTTMLIQSVLSAAGRRAGILGTVFYGFPGEARPSSMTTPDPPVLYEEFARIAAGGAEAVVMEVSSHALAQGRVEGLSFDLAVMTNLTRDHLDYHQTMEQYRDAKSLLFAGLAPGATAVLNGDDPHHSFFRKITRAVVLDYAVENPRAQVRGQAHAISLSGTDLAVRTPDGEFNVRLGLVGRFNVANALAAAAAGYSLGVPREAIIAGLEGAPPVPGRLEKVSGKAPFQVFVDYAHTDDALASVLRTLRELAPGRLLVLFGCGGDRDRGKRPLMGRAAERWADALFLTSDNPRSEDPEAILAEIRTGLAGKCPAAVIVDRREAIRACLAAARPGDCVLVAGKGHEDYQIFKDRTVHFDDREEVQTALRDLGCWG